MSKLEKTHVTKAKFMLHGGDYNPDQWLDRPDISATPGKHAGINHSGNLPRIRLKCATLTAPGDVRIVLLISG